MEEFSALELEAQVTPVVPTTFADHALKFMTGALFTAALIAGGGVVVIVALTIGVVAAPLLAVALGIWAYRHRAVAPAPAALRLT